MNQVKIHFLIPFYSNLFYLQRAVRSVIEQSSPNWLLTVVDDCGPDPNVVGSLVSAMSDLRVEYSRNSENLGITRNWNRCLDLAKSPYVTLLHADDELDTSYTHDMLNLITTNPHAGLYFSKATIIDEKGEKKFSFPDFIKEFLIPTGSNGVVSLRGEAGACALLRGNFIFCPSICYNMNLMGEMRFDTSMRMTQDFDMIFRVLFNELDIIGTTKRLYRYRRHAENATSQMTLDARRFQEEISFYESIANKALRKRWDKAYRVASKKSIVKLNLLFCIVSDVLNGKFAPAKLKFQLLRRCNDSALSESMDDPRL